MLYFKPILFFIITILFSVPISSVEAEDNNGKKCSELFEKINAFASSVDVGVTQSSEESSGQLINVWWQSSNQVIPADVSLYLFTITTDNVRYNGHGFISFRSGVRGPKGIEFASKWLRTVTPINSRKNFSSEGHYQIIAPKEGRFGVSTAIVAMTPCGEMKFDNKIQEVFDIGLGKPIIRVTDFFDYNEPKSTIKSNNEKYILQIFDHRFEVFDQKTGEKLLDERGYCPDFSPTSRFIGSLAGNVGGECIFYTSGEDMPRYQIHDLLFGQKVTEIHPPVIWMYEDTFVTSPTKWWKHLQNTGRTVSLLADKNTKTNTKEPAIDFQIGLETSPLVILNRDSGFFSIYEGEKFEQDWIAKSSFDVIDNKTEWQFLPPNSTNAFEPSNLKIANLDFLDDPESIYGYALPSDLNINQLFAKHQIVDNFPVRFVSKQDFNDYRQLVHADTVKIRASSNTRIDQVADDATKINELLKLNLETGLVKSNKADFIDLMWEVDGRELTDAEKKKFYDATVANSINEVLPEAPVVENILESEMQCWPSGSFVKDQVQSIWDFEFENTRVWLLHSSCTMIGTVGGLTVLRLDMFIQKMGQGLQHLILANLSDGESDGDENNRQIPANLRPTFTYSSGEPFLGLPEKELREIGQGAVFAKAFESGHIVLGFGEKIAVFNVANRTIEPIIETGIEIADSNFHLESESMKLIFLSSEDRFEIYDIASGIRILDGRIDLLP